MDFEKYKTKQMLALKDLITFFSKEKKQRELWVVKNFLTILGVDYGENEFNQPNGDPPDITFRDAKFETTELMDENRPRHGILKKRLENLELAQSYADIPSEEWDHWDSENLSPEGLLRKVEMRLKKKNYSPDVMAKTDALVYVNLLKYNIDKDNLRFSIHKSSAILCWRSVSLLFNGDVAHVLFASNATSEFIRRKR
ncbi:MAG: DUF1780 domain-containing protein [Thermodesulfobacteriota bacterium]